LNYLKVMGICLNMILLKAETETIKVD